MDPGVAKEAAMSNPRPASYTSSTMTAQWQFMLLFVPFLLPSESSLP